MKKLLALCLGCFAILVALQITPLGQMIASHKVVKRLRYRLIVGRMDMQMRLENGIFATTTPSYPMGGMVGGSHFLPANQPGVKLIITTPTPFINYSAPTVAPKAVAPISVIQPNSPIKPEAYHGSAPSPTQ